MNSANSKSPAPKRAVCVTATLILTALVSFFVSWHVSSAGISLFSGQEESAPDPSTTDNILSITCEETDLEAVAVLIEGTTADDVKYETQVTIVPGADEPYEVCVGAGKYTLTPIDTTGAGEAVGECVDVEFTDNSAELAEVVLDIAD